MNDLSVQPPFCDPVYEKNCGYNSAVPVLFFFSFVLISTLTMMKLVVAVILDNFGNAVEMDLEKEVCVCVQLLMIVDDLAWEAMRLMCCTRFRSRAVPHESTLSL